MTTNIDHPSADGATPRRRRDRTHWLYLAVIAAVLGGVALGLIAPSAGKEIGVLGTTFVSRQHKSAARRHAQRTTEVVWC
jgi:aerobic C4-dicarboxylate transport protein